MTVSPAWEIKMTVVVPETDASDENAAIDLVGEKLKPYWWTGGLKKMEGAVYPSTPKPPAPADYVGIRNSDGTYMLVWIYEGEVHSSIYPANTTPEIDRLVWLRDVSEPVPA